MGDGRPSPICFKKMENTIKELYKFDRYLLGSGYDNALEYINQLIGLETIEVPSGTELDTWTVPDEWIIREAWIKRNGEKILDWDTNKLSVVIGSLPFSGKVTLEELKNHLHYSNDKPESTPYVYKFYDKDWGFCVPKTFIQKKVETTCEGGTCTPELKEIDQEVGKIQIEGIDYKPKWEDSLEEGEYEVFIDTEYRPGTMKLGVHTIKGKSEREILLFAHLDHPWQANDNLSGVACLVDLAKKIKSDHTIKIIFCPETIGSIAYGKLQDISKVDFVVAIDICGNDHSLLLQKSFNPEDKLNRIAHCTLQMIGKSYRKGNFRNVIGSDEYYFNDPKVNIPGILLSRFPYKEYHTELDTPEIINYEMITETQDFILKLIETYEKDYVPVRNWTGPLMRSRYDMQSVSPALNLNYDYLFYSLDGKRSLAELCCEFELNFDMIYEIFEKLIDDKKISRLNDSQGAVKSTTRKKSKRV